MTSEHEKDILNLTDDENEFEEEESLPEFQGTLSKWTNYLHGWQDRYIVLKDATLSYYKSESETAFGCRGAVSLHRAGILPHQFDECRFDVRVNDSVWYLRAGSSEEQRRWVNAIEHHKQAESGYGSENNLRRHGSVMSITSATSLSTASSSSFNRGRGLKEKLAEMETFRDILCRQIDTLQSYFDSCASALLHGAAEDVPDDFEGDVDWDNNLPDTQPSHTDMMQLRGKDLESILSQHGGHALDFKGEAFTFKATTSGIVSTLTHCIELMSQREESWKKRLDKEVERRKKYEDAYKSLSSSRRLHVVGGPDYEEGPHCMISEDEFFDAVDATLDKLEKEEDKKQANVLQPPRPKYNITLPMSNALYHKVDEVVNGHLQRLMVEDTESWQCIADQGDLKVFKRELEENGIVLDPLKAVCTVKRITGHEVCHYFWNFHTRMEWEATLESSRIVEWLSDDTFVNNNVVKRVWPASQRDACFWSHIRHVSEVEDDKEDGPDRWIVVNHSCEHPGCAPGKYVRITMNVAMICQTIVEPPADGGDISRDNITCKITYTADVNPGGWAPASVLRSVYKREYPKFLRRITQFVADKTADQPILF